MATKQEWLPVAAVRRHIGGNSPNRERKEDPISKSALPDTERHDQGSRTTFFQESRLPAWWPEQAAEAVRLGLTVVVALYLAMEFELARPEWAAWTVLSVSLATRASSLEKAAWRVVGTLIGAVASLAITAGFAQDTLAFDVVLALWLGMATALASTARGQDQYGFALIGFTVPIITLSNVSQPQSVFPTAVDRGSALLLGIACAYASAALVASDVGTVRTGLANKVDAAARACAEWWQAGRGGDWGAAPVQAVLALDTTITDALVEHPSLKTGGRSVRDAAPALLSLLASGLLEARLPQADKEADLLLAWDRPGIGWRLRRCCATARMLRRGHRISTKRARSQPLAFDRDWRLARNNAIRTMTAVSLVNAFWYVSQWSSGGAAVTWAGLVSILLATRENPARDALNFLKGAALADLIGTAAHYTVLTSTGDFFLLAAVVLPISMLAAVGRADKRVASAGGFGIVVFSALDPLNVMDYDLASNLNGVLANLLGVAMAVLAFAALPPPASPATRRARVRRRIGRAVSTIAKIPAFLLPQPGRWCAPMFERAALLMPEGAAAVADAHTLMLAGLLLLVIRQQDDALGRQAGRLLIEGGPDFAGRLARLRTSRSGDGLQRRRLMALAALLEPGVPRGFPGLSPAGLSPAALSPAAAI